LADNARQVGDYLKSGLQALAQRYSGIIQTVRGLGLMLGIELAPNIPNLPGDPSKSQAVRFANLLHAAGLLAIPAGAQIMRFLPPLNLRQVEAEEGLKLIESVVARLAG
jgi:acetylornithine/succinyldiaminopimelate/putrescine aminotransferase